jgi:membrane protease YdiL (CAAX protease family)
VAHATPSALLEQKVSGKEALVAGGLALASLVGFWIVLIQLVKLPARILPGFSNYPLLTILIVLLMAPLVSTLAEEIGFRGYFQGALESKVSIPVAIVIAALVIAPAHSLTQGFLWPILLWYFCADVMFGVMAYLTQSILPGIVIHSLGLLIFFAFIWPNDAHRPLVLETGADAWFWVHLAQTIISAVLALLAFRHLATLTQRQPDEEAASVTPGPFDKPAA